MSERYGNKDYWCFYEEHGKEVAIWRGPEGTEQIIAHAIDKYEAKLLVDALLKYTFTGEGDKFGKREMVFLEFIEANCQEPYRTMAMNAIMWNDRKSYNNLIEKFPVIYSST